MGGLELVICTARTFQPDFGWLGRRFVAVEDVYSAQMKDTKSISIFVISSRTFDLEFDICMGMPLESLSGVTQSKGGHHDTDCQIQVLPQVV
jgi:hypothetical protein